MSRIFQLFVPIGLVLLLCFTVLADDSCLDSIQGKSRDPQFDLAHDLNVAGNSFSCEVGVRASEAISVLEDFRYGFLYNSLPHLKRSIRFPLKITIATSKSDDKIMFIKDLPEWLKFKAGHFDKLERAAIACAHLGNVLIVKKWSGFAIGLGTVWFFNSLKDGLRVGQINVAPMSEKAFQAACVVDVVEK